MKTMRPENRLDLLEPHKVISIIYFFSDFVNETGEGGFEEGVATNGAVAGEDDAMRCAGTEATRDYPRWWCWPRDTMLELVQSQLLK